MSTQMQLARAPWGLGWRLAGGASAPPGVSPNSPVAPGAPDDGEPFDNPSSLKSRLGAAVQGLGAVLNPQGGGLESFLSGATGAYTGTQQNLTQAAQAPYERARAARVQGIGDALKGAQTDYYQGLAAREQADANAPAPVHRALVNNPGQAPYIVDLDSGERYAIPGTTVRPFAPTRAGTTRDPALGLFQRNLDKVRGEKVAGLPVYNGDEAVTAEALRRTRAGGYPGFAPPGLPTTSARATSAADRWDQLTASGMAPDAATAQVRQEIQAGTVTP